MAHPRATMEEMERESARRQPHLQARMLQDMALASAAADVPAAKARGGSAPLPPGVAARCGRAGNTGGD